MDRVRIGAMVGVLVLLAGCGALGRSGNKGPAGPAPKPAEVIDAMRADVVAAVQAALPGRELNEPQYDRYNCASSRWKDTSGSGKIVQSESAGALGTTADKRSVSELIGVMVTTLEARGWAVRAGKFAASDPRKEMAKQGVAGTVQLGASRYKLPSGETIPTLNAVMYSDCLPNPDPKS